MNPSASSPAILTVSGHSGSSSSVHYIAPDFKRRQLLFDSFSKLQQRQNGENGSAAVISIPQQSTSSSSSLYSQSGRMGNDKAQPKSSILEEEGAKGTLLYSWGAGYRGELGLNTARKKCRLTPTQIDFHEPVQQVACGGFHSAILTDDGRVYTWGDGRSGQLGNLVRKHNMHSTPHLVDYFIQYKITISFIGCGQSHTAVISTQGRLYTFGSGKCGQLGHGIRLDERFPRKVEADKALGNFVRVACGDRHTAVLNEFGQVITFGSSQHGQLGHGDGQDQLRPVAITSEPLASEKVTYIECGATTTAAITEDGKLYLWGFGESIHPKQMNNVVDAPRLVEIKEPVKQVALGQGHVLVLTAGGDVYSFGTSSFGQLGHGATSNVRNPRLILRGKEIQQISAGRYHSTAVSAYGIVYSWGCSESGQLGHDNLDNEMLPRIIESILTNVVGQVKCGQHHSLLLSSIAHSSVSADVQHWKLIEDAEYKLKQSMLLDAPNGLKSKHVLQVEQERKNIIQQLAESMRKEREEKQKAAQEKMDLIADQDQLTKQIVRENEKRNGGNNNGTSADILALEHDSDGNESDDYLRDQKESDSPVSRRRKMGKISQLYLESDNTKAVRPPSAAGSGQSGSGSSKSPVLELPDHTASAPNLFPDREKRGEEEKELSADRSAQPSPHVQPPLFSSASQPQLGFETDRGIQHSIPSAHTGRIAEDSADFDGQDDDSTDDSPRYGDDSASHGSRQQNRRVQSAQMQPSESSYGGFGASGFGNSRDAFTAGPGGRLKSLARRDSQDSSVASEASATGTGRPMLKGSASLPALPRAQSSRSPMRLPPTSLRDRPQSQAGPSTSLVPRTADSQAGASLTSPLAPRIAFIEAQSKALAKVKSFISENPVLGSPQYSGMLLKMKKDYNRLKSQRSALEKQCDELKGLLAVSRPNTEEEDTAKHLNERVKGLNMKLVTLNTRLIEAEENKKNYELTIIRMKEEDLQLSKQIDHLRHLVGEYERLLGRLEKMNEKVHTEKAAVHEESAAFYHEINEFMNFADGTIADYRSVLNASFRQSQHQESLQNQREMVAEEKRRTILNRLREEAEQLHQEQQELKAESDHWIERVEYYEKRFRKITAATGCTRADQIIAKYYFNDEITRDLQDEIGIRKRIVDELRVRQDVYQHELREYQENKQVSKWKDVSLLENKTSEQQILLNKNKEESELWTQRLALAIEGMNNICKNVTNILQENRVEDELDENGEQKQNENREHRDDDDDDDQLVEQHQVDRSETASESSSAAVGQSTDATSVWSEPAVLNLEKGLSAQLAVLQRSIEASSKRLQSKKQERSGLEARRRELSAELNRLREHQKALRNPRTPASLLSSTSAARERAVEPKDAN